MNINTLHKAIDTLLNTQTHYIIQIDTLHKNDTSTKTIDIRNKKWTNDINKQTHYIKQQTQYITHGHIT